MKQENETWTKGLLTLRAMQKSTEIKMWLFNTKQKLSFTTKNKKKTLKQVNYKNALKGAIVDFFYIANCQGKTDN